jgi:hypothetical protein
VLPLPEVVVEVVASPHAAKSSDMSNRTDNIENLDRFILVAP